MKLTHPKIRHVKFKLNEAVKSKYPLTEKTNVTYDAGTEENYKRFGLRWNITFINKAEEEVILQVTESRAIFELEEPKKDNADLKFFIQNAFIGIQNNLQDQLPNNLKHLIIAEPNYDEMTETLMKEILKVK
ncbi:MAG: hypothetical protein H0W84_15155 [Bacteroidetes bacterium]|nr:hypothetical protein [Bacteroidota bacterium]